MARPPLFSVNLCCHNSARFLEETLASVFAQTWADYELVVVNDGSQDATEEIVRRHLGRGRRVVYHAQANSGLGAARNQALRLSSGKLIALLDHDDVWEPRKLELLAPLFARPEVGFAASDAAFMDAQGRFLGLYSSVSPLRGGRVLRELFLRNFVPCAAAVLRRSAVAEAGGFFRDDLRIAEEYELFLRLAERGEFAFAPEPLVRIRVHPGSAGWDYARERCELRRIYQEVVQRNPGLAAALGPRVLAVKEAGFWLDPDTAEALGGRGRNLPLRLKAEALYLLAQLPSALVDGLRSAKRAWARGQIV